MSHIIAIKWISPVGFPDLRPLEIGTFSSRKLADVWKGYFDAFCCQPTLISSTEVKFVGDKYIRDIDPEESEGAAEVVAEYIGCYLLVEIQRAYKKMRTIPDPTPRQVLAMASFEAEGLQIQFV